MTIRFVNIVDVLYPLISAEAPGLNEFTALDHLRWAARKLCQEAHVSQDDIETTIAIGDPVLYVQSPNTAHLQVHRVLSVQTAARDIEIKGMDELNRQCPGWRQKEGTPYFCTANGTNEMLLSAIPTEAEALVNVRVALIPTTTTTKLDEGIAARYADTIADGALSRILAMGKQPWTDKRDAADRRVAFYIGISRARADGARNKSHASIQSPIKKLF